MDRKPRKAIRVGRIGSRQNFYSSTMKPAGYFQDLSEHLPHVCEVFGFLVLETEIILRLPAFPLAGRHVLEPWVVHNLLVVEASYRPQWDQCGRLPCTLSRQQLEEGLGFRWVRSIDSGMNIEVRADRGQPFGESGAC